MEVYLVGGAVRDERLGLPVKERDWVVVGATVPEIEALGYVQVPGAFPVFHHPQTGEEYALARREKKTGMGHKGFAFEFGPEVTLEEDLRRRDLTINAMAQALDSTLIDPFGGQDDLQEGFLRHVSPAFVEDPLRVVRVARFAAKLSRWGFRVAHGTHRLMKRMANSGELSSLPAERIWQETEKALAEPTPGRFFDVLRRCGALPPLFPELTPLLREQAGHGVFDDSAEVLQRLDRSVQQHYDPPMRWAVLMACLAWSGDTGGGLVSRLQGRLRVPRPYGQLAELVAACCPKLRHWEEASGSYLAVLDAGDAWRRPERFARWLDACELAGSEEERAVLERLRAAWQAAAQVKAEDVLAAGVAGAAVGQALHERRLRAIEMVVGVPLVPTEEITPGK